MLANKFVRKYPGRYNSQKQERIEKNYHYHNNMNLFVDAKM